MTDNRRSLRRKPPPLDDRSQDPIVSPAERIDPPPLHPYTSPQSQSIPHLGPATGSYPRQRSSLRINPDVPANSDFGISVEQYADDSLLSYESPRPKGPQDLPLEATDSTPGQNSFFQLDLPSIPADRAYEYTDLTPTPRSTLDVSPSSHSQLETSPLYRKKSSFNRKFQNLSQKGTSPFQMSDSDDDADYFVQNPSNVAQLPSRQSEDLPYPVTDISLLDEYSDDSNLYSGAHNHTWSTPTKIPDLVENSSVQKPFSTKLIDPESPQHSFLGASASRLAQSASTSPESPSHSFTTSLSSSPAKSSLYKGSSSSYWDNRSSRSPSPKKIFGPSPGTSSGIYPSNDDYFNLFEDYYNEERVPRWSLIERDDLDYFDDSFLAAPYAQSFDYDDLPDLPKLPGDTSDKPSAMEFVSSPSFRGDVQALQSTHTIKKKNAELPPVPLDLPSLPFSSSLLSALHFSECSSIWSLKCIFQWCQKLACWTHNQYLQLKDFRKVLVKLIAFHRLDIPIDLISRNVSQIINSLTNANLLIYESEVQKDNFKFSDTGEISGVLVDLAMCYCRDKDHCQIQGRDVSLKCYSPSCQINKLIEHEALMRNCNVKDLELGSDWASHWKLTVQDMTIDPSESKRQSFLFDLIKFEQNFIQRTECFIEIAGPEFLKLAKLVVGTTPMVSMKEFEDNIFNSAKELLVIHRSNLFEPLLKILIKDGRFIKDITGMAQLYESWAKAAKSPLLAYMKAMPMIEDLLSNSALKSWDESIRQNSRMKDLQVNGNLLLISTLNSRYQQLPLQLKDVRKFYDEEDNEFVSLVRAEEAIRKLGTSVNEMKVHADNAHSLKLVEKHLSWKSNIAQPSLHLQSSRRKFFYRGDVLRKGDLKISSSTVHLIVLDNYLLITDRQRNQRTQTFKVSETPIPMDFLIIEKKAKEAVGVTKETFSITKTSSSQTHPTNSSAVEDENTTFPFKVRYAGRGKSESHTFFAPTEKERQKWITVMVQARNNLIKRVSPLNPYQFKLIDNSFFAYEPNIKSTKLPIMSSNDPIRILAETGLKIGEQGHPNMHRQVQCSQLFNYMNAQFHLLGTSSGAYCSDERNIWKKIVNMNNISKLTVLPALNVVLVLANKTLRYYPLQSLINIYYEKKEKTSSYQLSNEAVSFYEYGLHRGLPTVFVAKRKSANSTTFKVYVMESDNNGILSTFSVVKKFYIQAECHGISIFNSTVAVHTHRGFEILDLNKLSPKTIPEIPTAESSSKKINGYHRTKDPQSTEAIKRAIAHSSPMGMYKLANKTEFLLVYSGCAIFVNSSGKLSRQPIIRFEFHPKSVAFTDNNLILVCEEVIEIWSISETTSGSSKLIQAIVSKDLHMLDGESRGFRSVNPRNSEQQLLFRLVPKIDRLQGG